MKLGLRGRQAVRSFCPAQPVDFRQEKTEMVYSENALSAQFHLRALETWGGKILTIFKVRSCFLQPTICFNEFFLLRSVCFTVFLSSHALPSPLYSQVLINVQHWLFYFPLAMHLPCYIRSLIPPLIYQKQREKNRENLFCWKAIHLSQF